MFKRYAHGLRIRVGSAVVSESCGCRETVWNIIDLDETKRDCKTHSLFVLPSYGRATRTKNIINPREVLDFQWTSRWYIFNVRCGFSSTRLSKSNVAFRTIAFACNLTIRPRSQKVEPSDNIRVHMHRRRTGENNSPRENLIRPQTYNGSGTASVTSLINHYDGYLSLCRDLRYVYYNWNYSRRTDRMILFLLVFYLFVNAEKNNTHIMITVLSYGSMERTLHKTITNT